MPSRTTLAQLYGAAILTGVGFTMSPLLMAGVIAFLMLTWRTGWQLLEHQRSKLRQREDEFVAWVLDSHRFGCRERRRSSRPPAQASRSA